MLLAEALARRGDLTKKLVDLKDRATSHARYQDGTTPEENANDLAGAWLGAAAELTSLVVRINLTNANTRAEFPKIGEATITEALAERDRLGRARRFYADLADAASGKGKLNTWRFGRDEIVTRSAVNVPEAREFADRTAQAFRELDQAIQKIGWQTELLEE